MHKLRATGILQRLNKNIDSERPNSEVSSDVSTDFTSVTPIFAILAVGLSLAMSVFLLEFAIYKIRISFTNVHQRASEYIC